MERVCVVIPAYNDWESAQHLLVDLDAVGREHGLRYRVVLVDDSSNVAAPEVWPGLENSNIDCLKIVRLACNLGHQRAIAIGLVISRDEIASCTAVVVMDADGEDRPQDIPQLLASNAAHRDSIICARRARRSEPLAFRLGYGVYKLLFGSLTGTHVDFGNFCLIPKLALRAVISQAGIWNHLAATLTRSRVPLVKIDTARGPRYAGQSKMNFVSLVVHGLTAVAVYADVALVRIVILAMACAACAFAGIIATTCVRLATPYAIPGWASSVAGTLMILLFQAVLIPVIGVFVVLSLRTARTVVPVVDAKDYVESIKTVHSGAEE
jgi:glycosyltransferase involved in cell wall biosynthesis